ncbi:MAG: CbtA family protein, partial [Nocardioidaceae bacterium]|nr:CbtA family protein [Nocardioidaceae bacterium]
LVVGVVAGLLLPTGNELGDFPADTLWYFRRASLITLLTLWGAIGVLLIGLLGRLHDRAVAETDRRELAASI